MDVSLLSDRYLVRELGTSDVAKVYELCRGNRLYYRYCPPFVSERSILDDMNALPPNKERSDKYYAGFFDGDKLIAVMDLILAYPDASTAFIGFFMTDASVQNSGVGSRIIEGLCAALSRAGVARLRLGWAKGNPQAEHFWHKNGFRETGVAYDADRYTVIVAQRRL